jgi:hypothetical protein
MAPVPNRAGRRGAARRAVPIVAVAATIALGLPAAVTAHLPKTDNKSIVPGRSMGGVKLDMKQAKVMSKWGPAQCFPGFCAWEGKGKAGHRERATVSFVNGKVSQIVVNAKFTGDNLKFKAGPLAKWETSKHIRLGSSKGAVPKAYPGAKPNDSEGVQGFDLFAGARPNLRYTRFSTSGIGDSPKRLRYIEIAWDSCHYMTC